MGPGKRDDKGKRNPLEVKEGDRILFGKYAGTEIKIDGEAKKADRSAPFSSSATMKKC